MKIITYILLAVLLPFFSPVLQAACETSIPVTTPDSNFIVHGDGTVTHNKTGLMWKVCSEGQSWSNGSCTGATGSYAWQAALQIPQTLNIAGGYAGHSDWRLPNIKELASIVELACYDPAINSNIFPLTNSLRYWSASPYASYTYSSLAWSADFFNGNGNEPLDRSETFHVRLVRGGQ